MRIILSTFLMFLLFNCEAQEIVIKKTLPFDGVEPHGIEPRIFYNENNVTWDQESEYLDKIDAFFNEQTELLTIYDTIPGNLTVGHWEIIWNDEKKEFDFKDYKSSYKSIDFELYNDYYRFDYWGSAGSYKAFILNENIYSTISTMGWIAPILRFEIIGEHLYIYILGPKEWELADFHNGGKNYYIKTSSESEIPDA